MDFLSNGFGLLATVFGVVALAGGAAGYFKASRGDSIIKYQATEIQLRDDKVNGLEKDLVKANEASTAKDATIRQLEDHNKYLQKMGQGSPQLKRLTTVIENNTKLLNEFISQQKDKQK
jgi:hypothetical protein